MAGTVIKNIMTRHQERLLRNQLRRHIHGSFLKVGDKKIPPGRTAEISPLYQDQIEYLEKLGVIEVISVGDNYYTPPPTIAVSKPTPPAAKPIKFTPVTNKEVDVIEFEDFVIIAPKKDNLLYPNPEEKNKEVVVETKAEVKEEIKEIKAEIKEEIKEVVQSVEKVEEKIEPVITQIKEIEETGSGRKKGRRKKNV